MILKHSYWKCVLAALLLMIGIGGITTITSLFSRVNMPGAGWSFQYQDNMGHNYHAQSMQSSLQSILQALGLSSRISAAGLLPAFMMLAGTAATAGSLLNTLISIFIYSPLEVGSRRFFIVNRITTGDTDLEEIIHPFSSAYLNVVKTMFLRSLFTFLWTLLLFIPGIIKFYSYRMVPYILAEQPDMDSREAFRLSMEMMDGQKFDTFILDLSFIGWELLNTATAGLLGIFFVNPYRTCTYTELYATLRDQLLGNQ